MTAYRTLEGATVQVLVESPGRTCYQSGMEIRLNDRLEINGQPVVG